MTKILPRILISALLVSLMAGCSSLNNEKPDETQGWSAEKLFSAAKSEQVSRSYDASNKLLEKLEARFPYGRYAQQAQLEMGYNYYKDQEPALALAAIDRFIKQNPSHPSLDYALYLKGLVTFNESQGFMSSMSKQDMSERDPKAAKESFNSFRDLVQRFPESKYARDAEIRMGYLIGAMAKYELHVGRYYFQRGAYLAAANRGRALLDNYANTKQVEDALGLMIQSYDKLGMKELSADTRRVLLQNYPNSKAAEVNFETDPYWWAPI
ncbi:outer membrane protein assembly factor BamD [uncultured Deefgea sp.]|uniref:outer membrane protein assembly factor BamD n=1 Tax=uncultured Deefgea sp. TaxID=1304914 RepID=UPI002592BB21|nr:outer membrane protein assembly factor BamD [uncultured Deefgea sp.]